MAQADDASTTPWMALAEAIARAGSLAALLPYLRDGRILARHGGRHVWPGGGRFSGPGHIKPELWASAREVDGRIIFRSAFFAVDIELERAQVERLFPTTPERAKPTAASPPPWRKGDSRRALVWEEVILPCLAAKVEHDGPFTDDDAAIVAAKKCLSGDPQKRNLDNTTISRGVRKFCPPDWFAA